MAKNKSAIGVKQAAVTMLLFGFCLGYVVSHIYNQNIDEEVSTGTHMHEEFDATSYTNKPGLDITLEKDAKSGWNLNLVPANFKFTPENVNLNHVDGQGHAHLYIDGVKVSRLYSTYHYINELEEGEHTILVTLSTNDHKDYFVYGEPVSAGLKITEDGVEPYVHEHSEDHVH